MRTKFKPLSLWEQHQIDQFVNAVLEKMDLSQTDEELRQCAWAAFLSVFREDPRAFPFPIPAAGHGPTPASSRR